MTTRILVTNDDGIGADGIRALVRSIGYLAEVYVVAPAEQQSAMSQAMTLRKPLIEEEHEMPGAKMALSLTGTPADCVKFGLNKLREMGIAPDYVITGINMGANGGTDIHYSGTVAAAREGTLNGYKAIALSVASHTAKHFEFICEMVPELLKMADRMPKGTILNVNAPDLPKWDVKGVRITDSGARGFNDDFVRIEGQEHAYTYTGNSIKYTDPEDSHDLASLWQGYATITPLTTDLVDRDQLRKMQGMSNENTICLFLDVQETELDDMNKSKRLKKNLLKLAKCVRKLEMPVLVTEQYSRDRGPVWGDLKRTLESFEKIEKLEYDSTRSQAFESVMRSAAGKTVVLAGIESHINVQQTALGLLAQGYDVTILKDCCGSRKETDGEVAMQLLASRGCTVTTMEAFLYEVLGTSTHYATRTIQEIVRG